MDTDVTVALITGCLGFVTAITSLLWTRRLSTREAEQARVRDAKAVLDRYREPLLAAAEDLGHRIHNIRDGAFLDTYAGTNSDNPRRVLALRSTAFRVAKYFGWIELLEREVRYLHFETSKDTKEVSDLLKNVGASFATDYWSDPKTEGLDVRLMLWREEQRAIGGLMQRSGEHVGVIGFEDFDRLYDERFGKWLNDFVEDLEVGLGDPPQRLEHLQQHLAEVVRLLDLEKLYDGERSWVRKTPTPEVPASSQRADAPAADM